MVPVYHCLNEEGVVVLLCVIDRQLEATSISDFVTLDYVCELKVLIRGGSYPSAASTHRGQVVFVCLFVLLGGGGGDLALYPGECHGRQLPRLMPLPLVLLAFFFWSWSW